MKNCFSSMPLLLKPSLVIFEIIVVLHCQSRNVNALKVKNEVKTSVTSNFVTVGRNVWNCHELGACDDKLGLEAILLLHQRLDDDANGNIDISESDDFLRDELKYSNSYERQKGFHRNDKHITADELWLSWKSSEVHNWTVQETVNWLVSNVELPQYAQNFVDKYVDGTALPRMAINSLHFLSNLGIKDPIHKQKISLKAMDIVLFGPSKNHNYIKDGVLILSLIIAICGCWFAYIQYKRAQSHLKKTMKDMDNLQHAEESLRDLQKELDEAKQQQEIVTTEKKNLEQQLQNEITTIKHQYDSESSGDQSRVQELEQELKIALEDLRTVEKTLQENCWVPSPVLQQWLQLTYEMELQHYNAKKAAAEHQLASAKEGCEKLRKKRSSFLGTFRVAHGNSIDDVDNRISQAKAALSEVTNDLQERLHRWKQIELLCGFSVVHNPGIRHLKSLLGNSAISSIFSSKTCCVGSHIPRTSSTGTLDDDDSVSSFSAGISAIQHLVHNSATLFLAPLPSSTTNHLSMQRCPSCSSPYSDDSFPPFSRKPSFSVNTSNNEEQSLYGSLANIPYSVSQRSSMNFTAVEQVSSHSAKKMCSTDLKSCASSSAILQRTDAVCCEYSDSHSTDCESVEDKTNIYSGQGGSDLSKATFTIGESGKDIIKPVISSGLKHRNVESTKTNKSLKYSSP